MNERWFRYKHVPFKKAFREYTQSMLAAITSIIIAPFFAVALYYKPSTFTSFIAGYYLGWVVWSYSSDKWRKEANNMMNYCHRMLTFFESSLGYLIGEAEKKKGTLSSDEKAHM